MTPHEALVFQREALAASAELLAELRALRAAFDAADAEATEASSAE